ncbi:MAG: hypothetical protein ABRQ37_22380 [Candidatus Eremiobacterota bacterium]
MKRNTITIIEVIIILCVIVVAVRVRSCKIPESKRNYISDMTIAIKKQNNIIERYIILTDNISKRTVSGEEANYNLEKIKNSFIENKRIIETIAPPVDFINEHENFIRVFQCCIDSVDIYLSISNIKDEKFKIKKIKEAKDKIKEYNEYMKYLSHRTMRNMVPDLK